MQRSEGIGAIMTRLDRSILGFTNAVSLILFNVLPSLIFLCIAAFIMVRLDWRFALVVLVFAPLPGLRAMRAVPSRAVGSGHCLTDGRTLFPFQRGIVRHRGGAQLRDGGC